MPTKEEVKRRSKTRLKKAFEEDVALIPPDKPIKVIDSKGKVIKTIKSK